jgi:putative addiction module killer protein
MFSIRPLPGFTAWIDGLKDETVRGVVVARIKRLERGLMGDVVPVGDGISELRIHLGAGWRIYFTQRGREIIVLLVGGSKRTQKSDIKRAKVLAALLDGEENDHE